MVDACLGQLDRLGTQRIAREALGYAGGLGNRVDRLLGREHLHLYPDIVIPDQVQHFLQQRERLTIAFGFRYLRFLSSAWAISR